METLVLNRKAKQICDNHDNYELYVAKPNEKFTKDDIENLTESLFFWMKLSVDEPNSDLQIKINKLCHSRYLYCLKELRKIQPSPFLDYLLSTENIILQKIKEVIN